MLVVEHISDTGERVRTRRGLQPLDRDRQELAAAHVRLGYARADTYARRGMDRGEAISTALAAVVEAASRFDAARAIPFSVYCDLVVRTKLKDAAVKEARYAGRHVRHAEDQEDQSPDDRAVGPGRVAEVMEMVDRVRRVLPAGVFQLLWDVLAESRSMAEAGRDRGVSRQRAHQVVARGITRAQRVLSRPSE